MPQTLVKNFDVFAGGGLAFTGVVDRGLTGARVTLTVKQFADDADPGLLQIATDDVGIVTSTIEIDDDYNFAISIDARDTIDWPIALLHYEVRAYPNDDESYPPMRGRLNVHRRITLTKIASDLLAVSTVADATLSYGVASAPLSVEVTGGLGPFTHVWSVASNPSGVTVAISDTASLTPTVTLTGVNGVVTLRFSVTDSLAAQAHADVAFTLAASSAEALTYLLGAIPLLNWDATDIADGAVASWSSTGSDTAPLTGSGAAQPVRASTSFNGSHPGVTFDGVDDTLVALFTSSIAVGRRPWVYVVARMVALNPSVSGTIARAFTAVTAANELNFGYLVQTATWQFTRITTAGTTLGQGSGPGDTIAHVFGAGFAAGGLTLAVDGADCYCPQTGAIDDVINRFRLGSIGASSFANCVVAHAIVLADEPTWQQREAVNTYLRARWGLADTLLSTTDVFDVSTVNPSFAGGSGPNLGTAQCIGTYMYFLPWTAGSHTKLARWNMSLPFKDVASWSVKDMTSVGAQTLGMTSGCNDGRYIYISPLQKMIVRHDTHGDFASDASYAVFDLTTVPGSVGGTAGGCIFDGRYIYVIPLFTDDLRGHIVKRHDTQSAAGFTSVSSWEAFDIATVNDNCRGYLFGDYDGSRYVYFSPYAKNGVTHGQFLRYDTQGAFASAASWETFDLMTKNSALRGMGGIVCAAGKVYIVPSEPTYNAGDGHVGAMYDPAGSFTAGSSYTVFDFANVRSGASGFMDARYDGARYIYYPCEHTAGFCTAIRFDTQGAGYASAASYALLDSRFVGTGTSGGVIGMGISGDGATKVLVPAYHRFAVRIRGSAA